jgi:hypothetical protein
MKPTRPAAATLLAIALAAFVWTGPAAAQNLDLDEVGAALALPVLMLNNNQVTEIVVTNAGNAVRLHINLVTNGCTAQNFSCDVTKNETTLFVFRRGPTGQPTLTYECLDENGDSTLFQDVPLDFGMFQGLMFLALEDPVSGQTITSNQVFGDATVLDFGQGTAYSFGGVPFQGRALVPTLGDRNYQFNNLEYSAFPSKLATNFIAPTRNAVGARDVTADLLLFTLDFTVPNFGTPARAGLSIKFYNDDEMEFSTSLTTFACVEQRPLDFIDPRFEATGLGSAAGHLVMTPQIVQAGDLAHDSVFGGPTSFTVRKTPVHGWLVQTALTGADVGGAGRTMANGAAWARTLAQSQTALVPAPGDTPTFSAP